MRKIESPERFSASTYEAPTLRRSEPDEREEILLFAVETGEGDNFKRQEYFIPKFVSRAFSLQAMEIEARRGETAALYWSIVELIGEEGFAVMKDPEYMTDKDFDKILAAIGGLVFGAGKD